jgi:ribosomal protein S18 acetylase RimI-like enzyme
MPTIRQATNDDAAAIGQLVRGLVNDSLTDPEGEDAARFYDTLAPSEVQRFMAMPSLFYGVAEDSGNIVGMILIRDNNYIGQLFVAREHQRMGIGSALWQYALAKALQCGATGEFTVLSSILAKALYERFSFLATGAPEVKNGFKFIRMHRALIPMSVQDEPKYGML